MVDPAAQAEERARKLREAQAAAEELARELRDAQARATTQGEQSALKEMLAALEAFEQQKKAINAAKKLAAIDTKTFLADLKFGDDKKTEETKAAIEAAANAVFDDTDAIRLTQVQIDAQNEAIKKAKADFKKLLDAISYRTKELTGLRERVAKLQQATVTAAQSTAIDANYKTADSCYELAKASAALDALLASKLTLPADDKTEITAVSITDAINAEKAAQAESERLATVKKNHEAQLRANEERRKNAGR